MSLQDEGKVKNKINFSKQILAFLSSLALFILLVAVVFCVIYFGNGPISRNAHEGKTTDETITGESITGESEILSSQVKIFTDMGFGSGSIIEISDTEIVIVANQHLLADWNENGYVEFFNENKAFGQKFGGDEFYDVCFLSIPTENVDQETIDELSSVKMDFSGIISEDAADAGETSEDATYSGKASEDATDSIKVIDLFNDNQCYTGSVVEYSTYIYDIDKVMMLCKCEVHEGMSGAGVFDSNGVFWGIVEAGNDDGDMVVIGVEDIMKCLGE